MKKVQGAEPTYELLEMISLLAASSLLFPPASLKNLARALLGTILFSLAMYRLGRVFTHSLTSEFSLSFSSCLLHTNLLNLCFFILSFFSPLIQDPWKMDQAMEQTWWLLVKQCCNTIHQEASSVYKVTVNFNRQNLKAKFT